MRRRVLAALCSFPVLLHAEGTESTVSVYHPGTPWVLRYQLDDVLEQYNSPRPGMSTYAVASSAATPLVVTVQISAAGSARTAAACRDQDYARLRQSKDFGNPEVRFTQGADLELVVRLADGAVSRHLHRYWLRDGHCANVHVSRTPYRDEDAAAFAKLLDSVRFEEARETLVRAFVIPGRGTWALELPAAWGFRTSQPAATLPRDITFFIHPQSGQHLLLTLIPDSDAGARALAEEARQYALPKALEPDPALRALGGGGFYFMVTDKDLVDEPVRANDWKYLWQGVLPAGNALVFFSTFSNSKDDPAVERALRALAGARFIPN